jgi:hypothetical protein
LRIFERCAKVSAPLQLLHICGLAKFPHESKLSEETSKIRAPLAATQPETIDKLKSIELTTTMKDFLQEQGYKKSSKIYTPPILQLGQFNGINWIDELIPEFFWIGLLQQKFGFGNGSNIVSKVVEISLKISKDKNIWFAPISSFSIFTELEKNLLKNELQKINILSDLQSTFYETVFYYPDFPLSFLIDKNNEILDNQKLENFKIFLDSIFDRTSIIANLIQGVALDMIFRTEIEIKFDAKTSLADFPKFEEYPKTKISKQVADGIRSIINMLYSNFHKPKNNQEWQNYFWNRGLLIDKCI